MKVISVHNRLLYTQGFTSFSWTPAYCMRDTCILDMESRVLIFPMKCTARHIHLCYTSHTVLWGKYNILSETLGLYPWSTSVLDENKTQMLFS